MISWASVLHVRRTVETPGGAQSAISEIDSSGITPLPLGISETSPSADAPNFSARPASSMLAMQQILKRGRKHVPEIT